MKNTKEFRRYRLIQKLDYKSRTGNKRGCVKIWKGNKYLHERVKFDICYKLINQGYEIYTESEFSNKGRGDIVAISPGGEGYIIEVLYSESEERFLNKKDYYPEEFTLIKVKVNEFDFNSWEL